MAQLAFPDIRSFITELKTRREIVVIDAEVDPNLELAEIHRRIISEQGPALLFTKVKGSPFPVATNLFGTKTRVDLAFGTSGRELVEQIAKLPEELMPPSLGNLWQKRGLFGKLAKVGIKTASRGSVQEVVQSPPALLKLPALKTWELDGGRFITLPLVYTEHPETGVHNLGMYRIQLHSETTTGMHMQIGKGGGFHLSRAQELGQCLPANIFVGGPPVSIVSAIAPLPENVPELLLCSLLLGGKTKLAKNPAGPLPVLADAEFALVGQIDPNQIQPEGPFGDHYGYYSLKHDYPVFQCNALLHRKNAIFPATVVGKPRQEDFYIGDYLQELLSPLFPLVMPAVKDLWSYGETGFHSLAACIVKNRYKREAMASSFRILGEGQLSLTKFLLATDGNVNLRDFRSAFEYILERADFRTDLYVFSNLSMDTLDYTGPVVNEGSKGVLLGMGEPIREIQGEFHGTPPSDIRQAKVYCRGCLVISGPSFAEDPKAASRYAQDDCFSSWPMVVLVDDAAKATKNDEAFLWTTFTRFEPAADIFASKTELNRFHPSLHPPIVVDARMKPHYPDELECDPLTSKLVDERWKEYFSAS
jgi:UbiD family decarboxylase